MKNPRIGKEATMSFTGKGAKTKHLSQHNNDKKIPLHEPKVETTKSNHKPRHAPYQLMFLQG